MAQLSSMKNGAEQARTATDLKLSEHVHHVRMDDQIIVADMRSGHYLGLDGVGARVWELLGQHIERDAILVRLCTEYDVPMEVLKRDVEALLRDLLQRRLIEPEHTRAPSTARP